MEKKDNRYFESGAYRDTEANKNDYEGFLSPLVIEAFGNYMNKHRVQSDGVLRDSDNWQGMFGEEHFNVCMKSGWRHFLDWWMEHDGYNSRDGIDEALGGLIFNIQAYWHKVLLDRKKSEDKKN